MKKSQLLKLQKKAIKHYEKMIKWAMEQDPKDVPFSSSMVDEINEDWYGSNCVHCEVFFNGDKGESCIACPLSGSSNDSPTCCAENWEKMNSSETWKRWLVYANKVLNHIKKYGAYEE